MSIALERSKSGADRRIDLPGFVLRDVARGPSINSSAEFPEVQELLAEERGGSSSSSFTSSIGKNSDESADVGGGGDEEEVQSECKDGPFDSLDALEEGLPGKRGISEFYCGKSKSFTSLSDVESCSSIKDVAKPENAYTRKRKNLLAFNNFSNKNTEHLFQSQIDGLSKRPTNSRSMVGIATVSNGSVTRDTENSKSNSSSPGCYLPPLPPSSRRTTPSMIKPSADKFSSWRCFSLSDLQGATGA